jgi:hypothetical protein
MYVSLLGVSYAVAADTMGMPWISLCPSEKGFTLHDFLVYSITWKALPTHDVSACESNSRVALKYLSFSSAAICPTTLGAVTLLSDDWTGETPLIVMGSYKLLYHRKWNPDLSYLTFGSHSRHHELLVGW